jgi:hypothetical protein
MADDIRKETQKLSTEIDEASSELKEGFQKIIGGLKETNAPLAKTVANLRKQSKDTFAGALASSRLQSLSSDIDQFLQDGLDEVAFDKLQEKFSDIDLSEFKRVSESAKSMEDELSALMDLRDQKVSDSKVLQKKDAEIAKREMDALSLTGAALDAHMKKTDELKEDREKSYKRIAGGFDREIENQQNLLEEETKKREEFNESLDKQLNNSIDMKGLETFSDGLKELTGIDLVGALDTVTDKVNALGNIFGKEDLAGDLLGGMSNAISSIGASLSAGFATIKLKLGAMLTTISTSISGVVARMSIALKTFVVSATTLVAGMLSTAASFLVAALPFIGIGLLIGAGVAAIVMGGMYLYEKFQENKDVIYEKLGNLSKLVGEKVQDIKDFFIGSFMKAKEGVGDFGSSLSDMFASFADFVSGAILSVREKLNEIGIGDEDELKAERAELDKRKKDRELAAQERAKESEERSKLSAIEYARMERKKREEEEKKKRDEELDAQIAQAQEEKKKAQERPCFCF